MLTDENWRQEFRKFTIRTNGVDEEVVFRPPSDILKMCLSDPNYFNGTVLLTMRD
jgi:hypothetical protein